MGYKFSTYATWWIRQAITRSIADNGRTIRVPVHMHEQINRVLRAKKALSVELGHDPSSAELARQLNMSIPHVEQILTTASETLSLDTPVSEDNGTDLGDFVEDQKSLSIEAKALRKLRLPSRRSQLVDFL